MYKSALAALILAALGGCHTCEDHEKSDFAVTNAKSQFDAGRFDIAKQIFNRALEYCPDNYDALIGYANACREYGTQMYARTEATAKAGKPEAAKKEFEEASANHLQSERAFRSALMLREEDLAPHYGLGLLHYQRATSPVGYPYPLDDRVNRRQARDTAIKEFETVTAKFPNLLQVRRYLGLALFAAGKFDLGRDHLRAYHDRMQNEYNKWLAFRPTTDAEKEVKRIELTKIELDIASVRDVFIAYKDDLNREGAELQGKATRIPAEEERLRTLTKDRLAVELMIRTYQLVNLNAAEMEVRDRCADYLALWNMGKLEGVQPMCLPPQGQEGVFYQQLQRKLDDGVRYRNINYRAIVVAGEDASVGFVCEYSTAKSSKPRPDTEVTLRFRRAGGTWRVTEHP
ncbi:MAG TPA: tetratricopeptide repeat protein [Planctomycetota bacterium]